MMIFKEEAWIRFAGFYYTKFPFFSARFSLDRLFVRPRKKIKTKIARLEHAILVPFPVPAFLHCAVGVLFLVGVVFSQGCLAGGLTEEKKTQLIESLQNYESLNFAEGFRLNTMSELSDFDVQKCKGSNALLSHLIIVMITNSFEDLEDSYLVAA